jgi:hypothetical protein
MQELPDPDASSPYYSLVMGNAPPDVVSTAIAVNFADDETWNCTDSDTPFIALPSQGGSDLRNRCQRFELDHRWINCWELTQQ